MEAQLNRTVRAYLLLSAFVMVGALVCWHILWPVTYHACFCGKWVEDDQYHLPSAVVAAAFGCAGGLCFATMCPKKQLSRIFLLSLVCVCIGFTLRESVSLLMQHVDRFDAFCIHYPQLGSVTYWLYYWSQHGLSDWLLPQMVTQVLATAATLRVQEKHSAKACTANEPGR
jgi:hypothetical protein